MRRGDIRLVDLEPVRGTEADKRRPALVISGRRWLEAHGLLWVMMITNAAHPRWPDDVAIDDLCAAGLSRPSVVRPAKIATVEAVRCEQRGRLTTALQRKVGLALKAGLA